MITVRDLKKFIDDAVKQNKDVLDYNVIIKQETAECTQVTLFPNNVYTTDDNKNLVLPIGRPQ